MIRIKHSASGLIGKRTDTQGNSGRGQRFLAAFVKSRTRRLILSVLMPPVLGAVLAYLPELINDLRTSPEDWVLHFIEVIFFLPLAFIFMGLQSVLAAGLMEWVVRRYAYHKAHIIVASTVFGMLSGLSIVFLPALTLVGALVGFLLGLILASTFEPPVK